MQPGDQVGSYRIIGKLGEGGMGVVYVAQHLTIDRRAVVKILHKHLSGDDDIVRRFRNEANAAASIRHPGIVDVLDVGRHESGVVYILMEHLEGESLGDRLRREKRLSIASSLKLVRQAAGALAAAHAKGIVHRDLKPDNLFIVPDPEVPSGERVKLLDFGIAKLMDQATQSIVATHTGAMMGTPVYMAPEQCRGAGDVDPRADLYSLGCILFELVCGRPPFGGTGVGDFIAAHMMMPPPSLRSLTPSAPEALERIVARLLAKSPDERYQDATALIAALDEVIPTASDSVPPKPAPRSDAAFLATAVDTPAPIATSPTEVPVSTPRTTLGASAAEVSSKPARRLPWLAISVIAGLAVVGAIVVPRMMSKATARVVDAGVAVAPADAKRDDVPTPAARAIAEEAWTTAIAACKDSVEPACKDQVALAQREQASQIIYNAIVEAGAAKDYAKVAAMFRGLDAASTYQARAAAIHDRSRDEYAATARARGAALAKKGKCKELAKLADQAAQLWPAVADAVRSESGKCGAIAIKPVKPAPGAQVETPAAKDDADDTTAAQLILEANNAARDYDYARSLELAEQALQRDAGNQQALTAAAIAACHVKNAVKAKKYTEAVAGQRQGMIRKLCLREDIAI